MRMNNVFDQVEKFESELSNYVLMENVRQV